MRKFVFTVLKFVSPLILLAYPFDWFLSHLLKQSHEYPAEFEVMNDIYSGRASCDVAIYGSSRAWVQVNSQVLADSLDLRVYNFGIDGHNFWIQYLRHLELIKHSPWPKKIILSVDIYTLQKRVDLYGLNQFIPYMLGNSNIREYTSSFEGFERIDYYLPLSRFWGRPDVLATTVKNAWRYTGEKKRFRKNGFWGIDQTWNTDFDEAKKVMKSYVASVHPQSVNLLEQFVRECEAAGVDLTLVYTPEYIEGQKFIANRREIINYFETLAKKNDLVFLDFSASGICYDKSLFYNVNHLNSKGALVFSSLLASHLKEYTKKKNLALN